MQGFNTAWAIVGHQQLLGAHAPHHSTWAAAQPGPGTEQRREPRPVLPITGTEPGPLSRRGPVPAPLPSGVQGVSTGLL